MLSTVKQIAVSCISYHKDGSTVPVVLFGFWKQYISHLESLLLLIYQVAWEALGETWKRKGLCQKDLEDPMVLEGSIVGEDTVWSLC